MKLKKKSFYYFLITARTTSRRRRVLCRRNEIESVCILPCCVALLTCSYVACCDSVATVFSFHLSCSLSSASRATNNSPTVAIPFNTVLIDSDSRCKQTRATNVERLMNSPRRSLAQLSDGLIYGAHYICTTCALSICKFMQEPRLPFFRAYPPKGSKL